VASPGVNLDNSSHIDHTTPTYLLTSTEPRVTVADLRAAALWLAECKTDDMDQRFVACSFNHDALSASLSVNIAIVSDYAVDLSPSQSVGLYVRLSVGRSVYLSVREVYCGKTADWIRMPFRMVSGSSR